MKKITLTFYSLFMAVFLWQANAQTFTGDDLGGVISDAAPLVSNANVSLMGQVGTEFEIDNVSLDISHTWVGDVTIVLESPSGTTLILADGLGGSGNDYTNTVFQDGNPNITTGSYPFTGTFEPEGGALNTTFDTDDLNGNWSLTVTDCCGGDDGVLNNFEITFNSLGVVGNPPQIVCPLDITVNTSDFPGDDCGAQVFFADAQAFDIEDGLLPVTQTMGDGSGSIFPVGDTIIEFSTTDSDGNTSTCDFTITVVDDVDPVAVCGDLTVELDASGTVTVLADELDAGSSDLCGGVSFSFDQDGLIDSMVLDCSNLGENTITLYVTDDGGNVVSCESVVTVEDNIAPEIVCSSSANLNTILEDFESGLPAGWSTAVNSGACDWQVGDFTWVGFEFGSDAMIFDDDACGTGDPNNVELLSDVYDVTGATSLDLTYDVAYRHLGTGSFYVEVYDGADWQNVATYSADTQTTTDGPFDLLAYANENFQVRYTYDDDGSWAWGAGVDNFLLEYEVPSGSAPQYFLDMNGEVTVDINDLYDSVSDNCSVTVSVGGSGGSGPCDYSAPSNAWEDGFNVASSTDFLTANDIVVVDGSEFTLEQITANIFSNDDIVSVDVTYYEDVAGLPGAVLDTELGVVPTSDVVIGGNFGIDGHEVVLDVTPYTFEAVGGDATYWIGLEVANTNPIDGSIFWEVSTANPVDNNPTALFDGISWIYNNPLAEGVYVFDGTCSTGGGGGGGLTFTCEDLGLVDVTITATDSSGNETSCVTQIEIIDNIAPVVATEDITVELGADGTVCIEPEDVFGMLPPVLNVVTISSDNASGAEGFTDLVVDITEDVTITFDWSFTTQDSPLWETFGYTVDGAYTQLTDSNGANNQTGTATVSLVTGQEFGFRSVSSDGFFGAGTTTISNFMPGFEGQFDPSNWNEVLTNSDGSAVFVEVTPGSSTTFDNCEITVSALDISCFTCADIGTPVTVTLFVSDASGNIASSTAVVTVIDALGPVIECPEDMTVDTDPDSITYTLPDYFGEELATATDNCTEPVTILGQDPAPGTLLVDGTHTITLTAEDEYGNESVCSFELTVDTILGDDDNVLADAIMMYPNPAEAYVNISNNSQIGLTNATIYDINGKLVSKFDLTLMSGEQRLDVSGLASGVYMVSIESETASVVKRLVKK